jgi:hypothetical protein
MFCLAFIILHSVHAQPNCPHPLCRRRRGRPYLFRVSFPRCFYLRYCMYGFTLRGVTAGGDVSLAARYRLPLRYGSILQALHLNTRLESIGALVNIDAIQIGTQHTRQVVSNIVYQG